MSEQEEDWKQKYRELTLELEQTQQHSKLVENRFRKLLSAMAVPLQGQNDALDQALEWLHLQLKQPELEGFDAISKQLQQQLRRLDGQQEKQSRRLLEVMRSWLRQLRLSGQLDAETLTAYEPRIIEAAEKPWKLPGLLKEMLALQQSWIERFNQQCEAETELNETVLRADRGLLLQRIQVELQQLLENISVPVRARSQMHALGEMLEVDIRMEQLPDILKALSALVQASFSDNSEEFENYLRSLSLKLAEVQQFLAQQTREEHQAGASQQALENQVRSDVQKLSATVQSSQDIGGLKVAVSEQLVGIVQVMDEMRRQEEHRDRQLRHNYGELIEKVELMEQETRKAKVHVEEERHRARTDPLTGLPNRTAYDEQISQELERWNRYQQHFSIAVADLDHFKKINDSYGHLAGDKVLRLVGRIMHRQSRRTDVIARYGGEEFVIIMPGTGTAAASRATEKLRQAIEESPFNFNGRPVSITMSFGVTEVKDGDDLDTLFARADKALYGAKQNGRNQTVTA
ncbi:MAG: diguanylate cyclase [Marinobacterium sp.]|nr:diguanylate cyclase [Marinobacterium sp.]